MERRDVLEVICGTAGVAVLGASTVTNEENSSTRLETTNRNGEEAVRREGIGRGLVGRAHTTR